MKENLRKKTIYVRERDGRMLRINDVDRDDGRVSYEVLSYNTANDRARGSLKIDSLLRDYRNIAEPLADLRLMYEMGYSLRELADAFGVSHVTIRERLLNAGTQLRRPGVRRDVEKRVTARRLRASGMTYSEIGERLGHSHQWAYRLVNEEVR